MRFYLCIGLLKVLVDFPLHLNASKCQLSPPGAVSGAGVAPARIRISFKGGG